MPKVEYEFRTCKIHGLCKFSVLEDIALCILCMLAAADKGIANHRSLLCSEDSKKTQT